MNRIFKFVGVGVTVTLIDYLIYELIEFLIFRGDLGMIGLSTVISGAIATLAAYLLHSHITWRERDPGRFGIVKFFLWNVILVLAVRPFLTWVLGLLGGLYDLAYSIFTGVGISFSLEFVTTTGVFVLMTVITMILNYFIYGRLVFGKTREAVEEGEKKPQDEKTAKKASKTPKTLETSNKPSKKPQKGKN